MDIYKYDVYRGPNIGVYISVNDNFVFLPMGFAETKAEKLGEYLDAKPLYTSVANTRLLGALMVGNNNGILLPTTAYAEEYDFLMSSGLYDNLTKNGSLVPHQEIEPRELPSAVDSDRYKIIKPTLVPYVSYPYEWCFSQLKDAALLTLSIQET
ncbi:MAG: hypothetical protein ACE5RM_00720, partial [Candidatus Nitrosomaritimum aestuariumsis]